MTCRIGRHVALIGGGRILPGRRGPGQRHQRFRRPEVPGRRRSCGGIASWPPTSGSPLGSPIPSPSTRTWLPTFVLSSPNGPTGRWQRAYRRSGSCSTPGLDLGKTARAVPSTVEVVGHPGLARVPPPAVGLKQEASSATSWDWSLRERRDASAAAHALGITLGCRVVRAHDVQGTCRVRDMIAAIMEAR